MLGLRATILAGAAMLSVAIALSAVMVSVEEVCMEDGPANDRRFARLVADGEFSSADMAVHSEPIIECEWYWR